MGKNKTASVAAVVIIATLVAAFLGSNTRGRNPTSSGSLETTSASAAHPSSSTSNATSAMAPSAVYQVFEANLTLRGETATIPCGDLGMGCPPVSNALIFPVELIRYGITYYYSANQTLPAGEPGSHPSYDVWFTNSTVFCVTPAYPQTPTCPTAPLRQTTISIPAPTVSTLDSSNGLSLSLSLSTNSSGKLNVSVADTNTLDEVSNITPADNWPVSQIFPFRGFLLWTGTCDSPPAGFEILQGNYGMNNYTEGSALFVIAQYPEMQCAEVGSGSPVGYTFQPHGNVTSSSATSGFWVGENDLAYGGSCPGSSQSPNASDCPLTFVPFPAGTYTIVAGDEWGNLVILHFSVA